MNNSRPAAASRPAPGPDPGPNPGSNSRHDPVPLPGPVPGIDAYTPAEVARRVENAGIAKARLGLVPTLALALLAGAFIAFGALLFAVVVTDSPLGFGPTRWLGGIAFSLGLVLVVVAGAELFTGNNLIVMAWASGYVSSGGLLRNWALVYAGNLVGATGIAWLVSRSGVLELGDGRLIDTYAAIAEAKLGLDFEQALVRGILCNVLVCLAVWLCMAAHSVSGKILAIVFPISAFVAAGFEHSVANMYFIPVAIFNDLGGAGWGGLLANLAPVTLGNILGGAGLVALVYWICYLRET